MLASWSMSNHDKNHGNGHQAIDRNEGEGSRTAARGYNAGLQSFIREDRVEPAAHEAKDYVDTHPAEAARAEEAGKAGPRPIARRVEELMTEGKSMLDRAVARVRSVIYKRRARR
jgi:hypothetical protein